MIYYTYKNIPIYVPSTGQRIKKIENEKTSLYFSKLYEKEIEDGQGGQTKEISYYYANGERVARKERVDASDEFFFHHGDHLGSSSVITDIYGNKVEETKYYPYGRPIEGGSEKYLYTGKELDRATDLYYYEARYYSPEIGRFVQPDSMLPDVYDPQQLNRYSYVRNNPVKYTDPSGHNPFIYGLGMGACLGAMVVGVDYTMDIMEKDIEKQRNEFQYSSLNFNTLDDSFKHTGDCPQCHPFFGNSIPYQAWADVSQSAPNLIMDIYWETVKIGIPTGQVLKIAMPYKWVKSGFVDTLEYGIIIIDNEDNIDYLVKPDNISWEKFLNQAVNENDIDQIKTNEYIEIDQDKKHDAVPLN